MLIAIVAEAEHLTFDNALTGRMGRADYERVLGKPTLPSEKQGLYIGDIAYRVGRLRTDFHFGAGGSPLRWVSVRLESEARPKSNGTQSAPMIQGD